MTSLVPGVWDQFGSRLKSYLTVQRYFTIFNGLLVICSAYVSVNVMGSLSFTSGWAAEHAYRSQHLCSHTRSNSSAALRHMTLCSFSELWGSIVTMITSLFMYLLALDLSCIPNPQVDPYKNKWMAPMDSYFWQGTQLHFMLLIEAHITDLGIIG